MRHTSGPPRRGHQRFLATTATTAIAVLCGWGATASLAPGRSADPGDAAATLVVGDSLAVGMRPHLGALLPGRAIVWDVRSGRTTPQGLQRLRAQVSRAAPRLVLISLGTNDGPDPRRFTSRLRRALAAIPGDACVVWASILRPRRKAPYGALNRVLRREARRDARLHLIDWAGAVRRGDVALPDGLHPDVAGYQHRSRMFAAAVARSCSSVGG